MIHLAPMAKSSKPRTRRRKAPARTRQQGFTLRDILRWSGRAVGALAGAWLFLILLFAFVNPIYTPYMIAESFRHGGISRDWVDLEDLPPAMARSVVAAEDANFCLHWGFDMRAIRAALEEGAGRGASTVTQQVVKNVFLWQGRSWPRKALEAVLTPVVELAWTKRRIVEVYLNVAETGRGVFGVGAASRAFFDKEPRDMTATEAALIAAVLPDPKGRNATRPSGFLRARAARIAEGAATIAADGRAGCFED